MLRKIIVTIIGFAIILLGYFLFKFLAGQGKKDKTPENISFVQNVFVQQVKNSEIPLNILSSGKLLASKKMQLRTEVTGILRSVKFNEGIRYKKGEVILQIDNQENKASVISQRSKFYTDLLRIMPDIKLDYPEVIEKWEKYLSKIDVNYNLPKLPEFTHEKEKKFISANGIISSYSLTKNMELRQGKFFLTAPFTGIITEALVKTGDLVSAGQKVGEISNVGDYELEIFINGEYLEFLKVGQKVKLTNLSGNKDWTGTVLRINPKINVSTQTAKIFIGIKNKELSEGMYLQASISAGVVQDAFEIDRKLLNDNNQVFIVRDSVLDITQVSPVFYNEETAIVKGLENNTKILAKNLPKAYVGMRVKVIDGDNKSNNFYKSE